MLYCYCFLILNGQILVEPLMKLVYRLIGYIGNQRVRESQHGPKTVLQLIGYIGNRRVRESRHGPKTVLKLLLKQSVGWDVDF